MHARVLDQLTLETDLRLAVERNEIEIYYQPIVSIETRRLSGFEALIRWHHPRRGMVLPKDIIPLAEETGMIVPMGARVIDESCRQLSIWQRKRDPKTPVSINVNVSSKQFSQRDLIHTVTKALNDYGVDGRSLKLELTESLAMEDPKTTIEILSELRRIGVRFQIDDFGTGYSSLSYLHQLPIDALKIDSSFIQTLGESKDNNTIVKAIISLAHNLDLDVVDEGIETEYQCRYLHALGCQRGQGHLFSKPLNSSDAEKLLNVAL